MDCFNPSDLKDQLVYKNDLCRRIYLEAEHISSNGISDKFQDLFMEQS